MRCIESAPRASMGPLHIPYIDKIRNYLVDLAHSGIIKFAILLNWHIEYMSIGFDLVLGRANAASER